MPTRRRRLQVKAEHAQRNQLIRGWRPHVITHFFPLLLSILTKSDQDHLSPRFPVKKNARDGPVTVAYLGKNAGDVESRRTGRVGPGTMEIANISCFFLG